MSLTAFNRMRRVEAMKAENIAKEEKANEVPVKEEKAKVEKEEIKEIPVKEEKATKPKAN